MISQLFEFHRPASLTEATALLRDLTGEATVLGGGTMLIPTMSANQVRWKHVISLAGLELDAITLTETHVRIGAMTTYAQLLASPVVSEHLPLLGMMAAQVTGGPSIWNQGTLGGSASYANPASDAPACLAALQATFELQSAASSRLVESGEYFLGAFRTTRRPDELLTHILFPLGKSRGVCQYQKYKACASSWPIVTVACSAQSGEKVGVQVAVGAAAPRPIFLSYLLDRQDVRNPSPWIDTVAAAALESIGDGWTDELADASYRRAIVPAVVRRNLRAVIERIGL